jgi:putative toxin-antitoxin system antitoxin component (TIGR02293 family)
MKPEHSGTTKDLIEVTQKAIEVLGDRAAADRWLHEPALALNGRKPIDLLSTRLGASLVKDHLTRMEFGVYE